MKANEAVAAGLERIKERIAAAAEGAGRDPGGVRLVVVSKDVDSDRVRRAVAAGATDIGENRAQELERKIAELADLPAQPRWHFIGTLQRNKARTVAGTVSLIHSVDSVALGEAIAARAAELGIEQDVLIQVNVAGRGLEARRGSGGSVGTGRVPRRTPGRPGPWPHDDRSRRAPPRGPSRVRRPP